MIIRQGAKAGVCRLDLNPDSKDNVDALRTYWNDHIHDVGIAQHSIGTKGFFKDLESYRFEKLEYLPRVVDFAGYKGKRLLEIGCGVGIDLVRFAKGGANVTGIDLAEVSIELARVNFALNGVSGSLQTMNGEHLHFGDEEFDVAYAHGVLQYTSDAGQVVREIHRVLKPGGEAILQVYNRRSWLYLLSKIAKVQLEHHDAPAFHAHTIEEFKKLLSPFREPEIIFERFPVKTRLQRGIKATVYNTFFVGAFDIIPKRLVRQFGWHILARAIK